MDAKTRLIHAMLDALQRKGLHGVGLTELLAAADAPKGVLYHHFPGGKTELAVAAIKTAVARLCTELGRAMAEQEPISVLQDWLTRAEGRLEGSGFVNGCPLASIALETGPEDAAIRAALATGFEAVRSQISGGLIYAGYAPAQASALSTLVVAAYEGGLIQARVAQSCEPMHHISAGLSALLAAARLQGDANAS